ncbi:MAG TPA: hypothetical protein VMV92_03595 [Streptosporangiaceae bacterium]|nr:hypothetical protein [Streptosporangiaceae bacterium]
MQVRSRDRGVISVAAFSGSLIGAMTGGIRAQQARDEIAEVWSGTQSTPQAAGPSTKSVRISWVVPALAGAMLVVAALIGSLAH